MSGGAWREGGSEGGGGGGGGGKGWGEIEREVSGLSAQPVGLADETSH